MRMSDVPVCSGAVVDFDAFYGAEAAGQVRRAALLTGSDEVANDVVHTVLVAMYERWESIGEPGPYLNRAVLNRCRDVGRRRTTRQRLVERLRAEHQQPAEDEYLVDALARLPFNQRAAVVLRYYAGHSSIEIAEALNCPVGSVGPWIVRGLNSLRKELQ